MWIEVHRECDGTPELINTDRMVRFHPKGAHTKILWRGTYMLCTESYEQVKAMLFGKSHDRTGEKLRQNESFWKGK